MKRGYKLFILLFYLLFVAYSFGNQFPNFFPSANFNNHQINSAIHSQKGFEPNWGQIGDFNGNKVNNILFFGKEMGFSLFFKNNGISYVIYQQEGKTQNSLLNRIGNLNITDESKINYARIDMDLINSTVGANNIIYEDELPGYSNYYLAHCPEGILNVKSYRKVTIKDIYPGIDWVFKYDETGKLHHEFHLSPGANPEQIQFRVRWADVETKDDGKQLILSTPLGQITDGRIFSYQGVAEVDVRYKYYDGILGYEVKNWNQLGKLIIDPPLGLIWATYYGGNSNEYGLSITVDGSGNVFVTGASSSTNFPTQNPGGGAYFQGTNQGGILVTDAFILKFNNSGVRQWATYYGGLGLDVGYSITTDISGNVFVIGSTLSANFPTQNPGGGAYFQGTGGNLNSDAFILKFTNAGVRLWATYYGGSGNEIGYSVVTDGSGNVFVSGSTISTNFPTQNPGGGAYFQSSIGGNEDAFILKFNNSGVRQWATYYGGVNPDENFAMCKDLNGNVFITGYTQSSDFPTQNPGGGAFYQGSLASMSDMFLVKFTNAGVRQWGTFYGGDNIDKGWAIITDASGNLFITGETYSSDFPTQNPGSGAYFQGTKSGDCDAFFVKFNSSLVRQWATYYGGGTDECGNSLMIDKAGNLFATGYTSSYNFPTQNPGGGAYFKPNYSECDDAFILEFTNSGVIYWATYYGGTSEDYGFGITRDNSNNVFVTGETFSTDIQTQNPGGGAYFQGVGGGAAYNDAFILKFQSSSIGIKPIGTQVPASYSLKQNYPNPFNATTNIEFDLPNSTYITLIVFDITGREISRVVNEHLNAGSYKVTFDAAKLPSGIYFYRLSTNEFVKTNKMILTK